MYDKKLELRTVESTESVLSKEERYELIALIAQRVNETKTKQRIEDSPLWTGDDVDFNFEDIVNCYN